MPSTSRSSLPGGAQAEASLVVASPAPSLLSAVCLRACSSWSCGPRGERGQHRIVGLTDPTLSGR